MLATILSLIMLFMVIYCHSQKQTNDEEKNIIVNVVLTDGSSKEISISTKERYLGKALISEKIIEGKMGTYGLFIEKVNGISANENKKEWWCLAKSGEVVTSSVDMPPIYDGDTFELTLTVGW